MREIKAWGRDVVLNVLVASPLLPRPLRWRALRLFGLDVVRARISAGGFYGSRRISIGEASLLNYQVFIDSSHQVTIGERCHVGMRTVIITGSHEVGTPARRAGVASGGPVAIGDGSWIGANVTILPGVSIGRGCVVAAGAVVAEDCGPDGLYAGVPARRIRSLD